MNKSEVVEAFKLYYPYIFFVHNGRFDKAEYREIWGIYTDSLARDGAISQHQYNTWTTPRPCP